MILLDLTTTPIDQALARHCAVFPYLSLPAGWRFEFVPVTSGFGYLNRVDVQASVKHAGAADGQLPPAGMIAPNGRGWPAIRLGVSWKTSTCACTDRAWQ